MEVLSFDIIVSLGVSSDQVPTIASLADGVSDLRRPRYGGEKMESHHILPDRAVDDGFFQKSEQLHVSRGSKERIAYPLTENPSILLRDEHCLNPSMDSDLREGPRRVKVEARGDQKTPPPYENDQKIDANMARKMAKISEGDPPFGHYIY